MITMLCVILLYVNQFGAMRGQKTMTSSNYKSDQFKFLFFFSSVPPKMKAMNVSEKWHKAFHGTKHKHVATILKIGELALPGKAISRGSKPY